MSIYTHITVTAPSATVMPDYWIKLFLSLIVEPIISKKEIFIALLIDC